MTDAGRLFDEHYAAIHRYLVRLCGDADLAADGAQEAFVRAFESPPSGGTNRGWLFTVATNYVLGQRRTSVRRQRIAEASAARTPMADPPRDAHDTLESQERRHAVRRALALLPKRDRVAMLMREEGFTHREIADAVGTTTGSVGTLIARAHARLAQSLHLGPEGL
jgi:RNA polymerase sigma factor (sigma-70 family)